MRMPAIRELPLAAALLLTAVAFFHGGAAGAGMVPWLGLGALVLIVSFLAFTGAPRGLPALAPLGTRLAFAWMVALVSTLSRGGVLVAVVVVALWLWLGDDPWGSAVTLVAAGVPAAAVAGVAFALPAVTGSATTGRWRDGLIFGA